VQSGRSSGAISGAVRAVEWGDQWGNQGSRVGQSVGQSGRLGRAYQQGDCVEQFSGAMEQGNQPFGPRVGSLAGTMLPSTWPFSHYGAQLKPSTRLLSSMMMCLELVSSNAHTQAHEYSRTHTYAQTHTHTCRACPRPAALCCPA